MTEVLSTVFKLTAQISEQACNSELTLYPPNCGSVSNLADLDSSVLG